MARNPLYQIDGPFYAESVREGDPYELSNGHPIECLPSGGRHSRANLTGGLVLETDPEVDSAGVDTGYASDPKTLRAPDIAVGNVPDEPGWVEGVPPLAVEYADSGQDEGDLRVKIDTLLAGGTRYIWVVRLSGPRQVEVYEPGKPLRILRHGQELRAPGVLKNPIPVEALYDTDAAHRTALRNLLQRHVFHLSRFRFQLSSFSFSLHPPANTHHQQQRETSANQSRHARPGIHHRPGVFRLFRG